LPMLAKFRRDSYRQDNHQLQDNKLLLDQDNKLLLVLLTLQFLLLNLITTSRLSSKLPKSKKPKRRFKVFKTF